MKKKFNPENHHRKSIRLKGYDYSQDGFYFITINCWKRNHYFGKIQNGAMFLNDLGKIAHEEWKNTQNIRPNAILHEFVIMPNHIHGIIELRGMQLKSREGRMLFAPTIEMIDSSQNIQSSSNNMKSPSQTIGSIIRGYKSAVTKQSKLHNDESPLWQRDYYEKIIRNKTTFNTISSYIRNNPKNWELSNEI